MKQQLLLILIIFLSIGVHAQPANDDCTGATPIPNISSCLPVSGSITGATASAVPNTCVGNANDDVWFSFVATSSITQIALSNLSNPGVDMAFTVFGGACGALGAPILCSDPNTGSSASFIVGNTYYIRTWSVSATAQTLNFDACGTAMTTACGTPATPNNQDYCYAPALLTAGAGTFSSTTSGQYTNDSPANLSIFCGSIENNSWYAFVQGSGTAATFNFTVSDCSDGVQAEVYDVTTDANGCCTNFTSMSNCWNPGTATAGTVTAEGLVTGQTYYLMVDGQAGDICDFTVANWTATGVLGAQLTEFSGVAMPSENRLRWKTKSEVESNYYEVQRSYDGLTFTPIGSLAGAGTTNNEHNYSFTDGTIRTGIAYYRLNQVDNNGKSQLSDPIELSRSAQGNGIISVYPNPASDQITIEINSENNSNSYASVELIGLEGKIISQQTFQDAGFHKIFFDVTSLEKGMYFIKCINNNNQISLKPFIKK